MKKIAIIVTWFGDLPKYFSAWLKSAEHNDSIDFFLFSDQEIVSDKENIIIVKTSMSNEIERYERKLNRKIEINNAYKLCDCRLFFGRCYEDYLKGYDFWGYCDVDMIFGDIRNFITDDVLEKYDRIYQYGHLCLYRNNNKMCNLYELKGGIYSLKEIFQKSAKTTPEEYYGANRICQKNHISWYTSIDFADFIVSLPQRLDMGHKKKNYVHQTFFWENGKAYRIYEEKGNVFKEELIYLHWQKRKPHLDCADDELKNRNRIVITSENLITNFEGVFDKYSIDHFNPPIDDVYRKKTKKEYYKAKIWNWIKADMSTKRIWGRQMKYRIIDRIFNLRVYD